jgi:protein LTV1
VQDGDLEDDLDILLAEAKEEGEEDFEDDDEEDDGDESDYDSEANDDVPSLEGGFSFSGEETKSKFTSYSMSSSVIRRNNQVTKI